MLVLVPMLGDPCREQRLLVGVRVLVLVAMLGDPCREQRLSVGGSGAGAGGDAAASTRAFTASLELFGRVAGLCFPERLPSALNPQRIHALLWIGGSMRGVRGNPQIWHSKPAPWQQSCTEQR